MSDWSRDQKLTDYSMCAWCPCCVESRALFPLSRLYHLQKLHQPFWARGKWTTKSFSIPYSDDPVQYFQWYLKILLIHTEQEDTQRNGATPQKEKGIQCHTISRLPQCRSYQRKLGQYYWKFSTSLLRRENCQIFLRKCQYCLYSASFFLTLTIW